MNYLLMKLPSGRKIAYPEPQLTPRLMWKEADIEKISDDGTKVVIQGTRKFQINPKPEDIARAKRSFPETARVSDVVTIYAQIPKSVNWGRVAISPGTLTENCIQGIAADFMAHGAINASRAGYEICALIHDEALAYYYPKRGQSLDEFVELLTALPPWAEGMPLKAEGDVVKFYKK